AANTPGLEAACLEITSGIARFAFTASHAKRPALPHSALGFARSAFSASLNSSVDDNPSKPSGFGRTSAAAKQKWNDNLSDLFVPFDRAKSDSKEI
ncbi:hypothetical protein, partial [Senegalimassilia anaerobia]|uniref:hypothetical protein n=1 Tax=Senegalimassilia anaerobia TaxID=1473216 RepID=UPI003A976D5B